MNRVEGEAYDLAMECYGWRCAECGSNECIELHHKLPKYKYIIRKFPLLIHFPVLNLIPLCKKCHEKFKNKYKWTEREMEFMQKWLKKVIEEEIHEYRKNN